MTKNQKVKTLTYSAFMTAFIIILGFLPGIPIGFIPVPIILQNLGIMMAGGLLGPKYGTISVGAFLTLALIGLPVLTGGNGGAASFLGPSGGYRMAWLFTPFLIGFFLKKLQITDSKNWIGELIIVLVFGVIFVDLVGAIWLSIQSNIPLITSLISNLVFIPGDCIKAILTVLIVRRLRKEGGFEMYFRK